MNRNQNIFLLIIVTNLCGFSQVKESKLKLTGIEWQLTKLGSDTIILTYPVTLSFKSMNNNKKRKCSGNSFCSYFGGEYKIDSINGILSINELITQDLMCDKENQQMDTKYFNSLQSVTNYTLENNLLKLYTADQLKMTFIKSEKSE